MALDFATFNSLVGHIIKVRKPVLIRGRHGIGKSEVVYQTAKLLGLEVVERRASQMTEGDLVGLPVITDDGATSFCPPSFFKDCCENARLLFLDEVDRAVTEVRQGIFELTDSRKLNGHTLHPDTVVFAAVNGGEHGAQYQVGEMDPAELDRWTVFDIEPSVEDWLNWSKDVVHAVTWDFVNLNHQHLEHSGEYEPNKVYPSRRSMVRMDECLRAAGLLENPQESAGPLLYQLAGGFIGFEAAVAFNDFAANYSNIVTPSDILDKGKLDSVKDFTINDHCSLIEKMDATTCFAEALTEEQTSNLVGYFVSLPSEAAMKLWTVMGKEGNNTDNVIRFHQSEYNGVSASSFLVELLTGDSATDQS